MSTYSIIGFILLFVGGAMCHEVPFSKFIIAMILITTGTNMIHWS